MEIGFRNENDDLIVGATLDASTLDKVIAGLAEIRSKMTPVPEHFPADLPTHTTTNCRYAVGLELRSGETLVSFRNIGLGWLSFRMPQAHLEEIARLGRESRLRLGAFHSDMKQ
jgi:hypothetical protein